MVVCGLSVPPSPHLFCGYFSSCIMSLSLNLGFFLLVDTISAIEFDKSGDYLAVGDRGGRVVIFERKADNDVSMMHQFGVFLNILSKYYLAIYFGPSFVLYLALKKWLLDCK